MRPRTGSRWEGDPESGPFLCTRPTAFRMTPRGLGGLALDRKKTSKRDKKVENSKTPLESRGGATCHENEVKKERPSSAEETAGNRTTAWKGTQKATRAGRGESGTQDASIDMLKSIQSSHKVIGRGYPGGAPEGPFSEDPSWLSLYMTAYRSSLDAAIPILVMLILMTLVFLGSPILALMMFPLFFLTGVFVLARMWKVFPNQLLGSRYLLVYTVMVLGMAGIHFFVEVFTWTRDYTIEQLLFIILFGMEPYFFWKSVTTDPGTVKSQDVTSLHGNVEVGTRQTCTTCKTNRPLRSKHCGFCGSCIRRFDHHCPLIYNCVGEGNQAYFLAFLTIGFAGQLIYLHLCLVTWLREVGYTIKPTWLLTIVDLVPAFQAARARHSMSVFWSVFHLLACPALGLLWIRQVTCTIANITTNEMANWHRYDYMQDKQGAFQNIFDAGILGNVTDFFSASIDWDHQMLQAQESMHRWRSKFPSELVRRFWLSRRPRSSPASCVRCVDDPKV